MIRSYVTSRSFAGLIVPVPAQNAALREFAQSKGDIYALPFLEHKFESCYMQLFTVVQGASSGDCIAMYSAAMLPYMHQKKLDFLELCIQKTCCELHFVLEGITTNSIASIKNILDSYRLREILDISESITTKSLREIILFQDL